MRCIHVFLCVSVAKFIDALGIRTGPWNRDLFQGLERAWREQAVTKRRIAEMAFFVRAVLQTCTHISLFFLVKQGLGSGIYFSWDLFLLGIYLI